MVDLAQRRAELPHIAAYEENLYHCASCNYCVDTVWEEWGIEHVCPTLIHHSPAHGYAGKGYIAQARAWFEGAALDLDSLAERAFTCTTCGNCEEVCPIGMRPAHIAVALRAELADRGHAPAFAVVARDAAVGAPTADLSWAEGLEQDPNSRTVFLAGCLGTGSRDEARAAARLLQQAGGIRLFASECCGASLAALGFPREAEARAQQTLSALEEMGAERIVVGSAECLAHLAAAASPELSDKFVSTVSAVSEMLEQGRLALAPRAGTPAPKQVGYVDPCHLTKKAHGLQPRGYAAEVRAILAGLGVAVVEPAASPRFQICCGAAGGMPDSKAEAARRMAGARLDEFAERGAEAVVTASPLCAGHLAASRPPLNGGAAAPPVFGLCEFLLTYFVPAGGRA